MRNALKKVVYRGFSASGGCRLALRLCRGSLRIINYHGVCKDHLACESWVPGYFITRSNFEWQLRYLAKTASVLPLGEAISRLFSNDLPPGAVALTFDDGYANSLTVAYPLLEQLRLPATIFLITGYVESGDFFPFDRPRLLSSDPCYRNESARLAERFWRAYWREPMAPTLAEAAPWWSKVSTQLPDDAREALRPLTVQELKKFDPDLVELGAHSHWHPVLRNESSERRELEIRSSIARVEKWTGRSVRFFAYPNGASGDFDEFDKRVLRSSGITAAFSTISGVNRKNCDAYEWKRIGVGLHHESHAFVAEIAGLSQVLRTLAFRD
jgi:peptidoglycan/xylan/chitin deacetylase (PgdA/CDA1 family)